MRDDFEFSKNTWHHNGKTDVPFASGRDCSSWTCTTTKKGIVNRSTLLLIEVLFHTSIVGLLARSTRGLNT